MVDGLMPKIIATIDAFTTLFTGGSPPVATFYLLPSGDFYLNPDLDKYELP